MLDRCKHLFGKESSECLYWFDKQEQIDDICNKSRELWEKQTAARAKKESDKQLKRPLHQPVVISRGPKSRPSRSHRPDHKTSWTSNDGDTTPIPGYFEGYRPAASDTPILSSEMRHHARSTERGDYEAEGIKTSWKWKRTVLACFHWCIWCWFLDFFDSISFPLQLSSAVSIIFTSLPLFRIKKYTWWCYFLHLFAGSMNVNPGPLWIIKNTRTKESQYCSPKKAGEPVVIIFTMLNTGVTVAIWTNTFVRVQCTQQSDPLKPHTLHRCRIKAWLFPKFKQIAH